MVGFALEQGCLSNLDLKMMDLFPEYADQITDPRKEEITPRQMLQMSAGYSNTTTACLAAIVSRSCDTNLKAFSEEYLLEPIGAEMGEFWPNKYDDYYPLFHFSARDAAKYGLLYLNDGEFGGEQIVPADWVHDSLQTYSKNVSSGVPQSGKIGRYLRDIGYGYQW